MKKILWIISVLFAAVVSAAMSGGASVLSAQAAREQTSESFGEKDLPLKKVTLYSSGVACYEHEGRLSGSGNAEFLFTAAQINDVLKSLVVTDPAAKTVSVEYQSEDTLRKTLESLKVNPSAAPTLYDLLKSQKGAELEVFAPHKITGKIISADKNLSRENGDGFSLSLAANDGIHVIPFSEIQTFKFTDEKRNEDLNTALDLMLDASAKNRTKLGIRIGAQGGRNVKISYVMEAPVWKASYRLDMGKNKALFQAWAIVDNSTDSDWNDVKLTLTTGRPVGFRQNLYAPYYTYRPELPLAIAQSARAETFASGTETAQYERAAAPQALANRKMMLKEASSVYNHYDEETEEAAGIEGEVPSYFAGPNPAGSTAGQMFAFTSAEPVKLGRQKSMMMPLTLSTLPAEKVSVFSSFSSIPYGVSVHPKFCIRIENTSGLKLPAGPVTVFDGGEYAGDALLEFLGENEKRLIAYGDDIEVSGTKSESAVRNIESVKIAGGILSVSYRQIQTSTYSVKNTDKKERTVIIEHAKKAGFDLATKAALEETTAGKYRFKLKAAGASTAELKVEESRTYGETRKILDMSSESFVAYTTNAEMPEKVKKAFEAIIKEREKVFAAQKVLADLQNRQAELGREQERVRKNLEALGTESAEGKDFLAKLLKLENELDASKIKLAAAADKANKAQEDFIRFVRDIKTE